MVRPSFSVLAALLLPSLGVGVVLTGAVEAHAQTRKDPKKPPKTTKTPDPPAASASAPPAAPPPTPPPTPPPPPAEPPPPPADPAAEPPRKTGWTFDGSLGLPRLKSDETSLAFDANVGYLGDHWGFGAYASSYSYSLQQDGTLNTTSKLRFGLEARYLSGQAAEDVRYEVKLEANSGAFNTTYLSVPTANGSGSSGFSTENSTLNRFALLIGRRSRVSEALRYKIAIGAGLQTDTYFRAGSGSGASAGDTSFSAASSGRYLARVTARYDAFPSLVAARLESEVSSFQIRRVAFFAGGSASDADGTTVTDFRETDASVHLFADIEKLAFLGLMPGVFAGLDFVSVSGDSKSTSALIPIFGVGLVNLDPKD